MIITNQKLPMQKNKKVLHSKKIFYLTNCFKYEILCSIKNRKDK